MPTGGFGGFGGFGGTGGFGGGPQTPGSHDQDVTEAEFNPYLGSELEGDQASPSREGIHPTQKPRSSQWRARHGQRSNAQNAQSQVIIDVDGEIVDD